ncbi:MAG: hypothetical protein AMJ58_13000, partial [Gammaproteobacteria bacterium SG8_30]
MGGGVSRQRLRALILDDGDLVDVRSALRDMGMPFLEAEPGAEPGSQDDEFPLMVTTPARARLLQANGRQPRHHLHLLVAERHRDPIDGIPCDFLVQRPVNPEVLRLLVERADYEGPERRRMTRVAIGIPVTQLAGDERHELVMTQLSTGGCGLVTAAPLPTEARIRLALPPELTHPRRLELTGRVLQSRQVTTADGPNFDVSIAFDPLPLGDRVTLRSLMAEQPVDFRPRRRADARGGPPRRGGRRREIGAPGKLARVVIGRELSGDGIRIERDPALALGDRFDLALYCDGRREPIELRGRIVADDEQ